jgi:RNA polymerase sigma-70 factor, ECF subfamily
MLRPTERDAIIEDVLQGNADAFRKILRAYGLSLRSYIAAHVHALDDIDDLAQEVFFVAYRNLGHFRREDDFGAWLRGIARNKIHRHIRSSSRRHVALEKFRDKVMYVVENKLERQVSDDRSERIEVLLRCIGQLPERMRRVVRAGLDGDKPADLAGELTTSVVVVYQLHCRANKLLRECMLKEQR